jgi:hypothetical protein
MHGFDENVEKSGLFLFRQGCGVSRAYYVEVLTSLCEAVHRKSVNLGSTILSSLMTVLQLTKQSKSGIV